jgi:hypothetical protein
LEKFYEVPTMKRKRRNRNDAAIDQIARDRAIPSLDLDADLGAWCLAQGLNADGTPLSGEALARWAHEQQIEDERRQAEPPVKDTTPFWRRSYAHDI